MADVSGKAGFDAYAKEYDAALTQGLSVSGEDKNYFAQGRVRWLAAQLDRLGTKPASIMDYGCGTGTAAPFLQAEFSSASVLGVDVSSESLAEATRVFGSRTVEFQLIDSGGPLAAVELVYCNGVFHHIPPSERAACMNYIASALPTNGYFALWENNPWNPATRYVMSRIPFDRDAITLTPPEARSLVESAGFEVVRTDFLFIFPRLLSALRRLEPGLSSLPLGTQYLVLARKR